MPSYHEADPVFLRLKSAWLAYERLQAKPKARRVPYTDVMNDPSDPELQAAAIELAAARAAWLENPAPVSESHLVATRRGHRLENADEAVAFQSVIPPQNGRPSPSA
jgi:hypothetical protein